LYILGYRNENDRRYYVTVKVQPLGFIPFRRDFLVDTGASRTQISWNDASSAGIMIRKLPQDKAPFDGIGGTVNGYILEQNILIFKGNLGAYQMSINYLSVSDFLTTDGRPCPAMPSMLGIDLLSRFDILFEGNYVILRM
jgi:predicted aspartyl protease